MTKPSVADALRELATGDQNRSETARLRDVIDDVEAALDAGVSRAAVLEALHTQGFTMTLKSFESALYRIRKQRERGRPARRSSASVAPSPHSREAPPAVEPDMPEKTGHLSQKQRGERKADQYIQPGKTNPLLKKIQKEKP